MAEGGIAISGYARKHVATLRVVGEPKAGKGIAHTVRGGDRKWVHTHKNKSLPVHAWRDSLAAELRRHIWDRMTGPVVCAPVWLFPRPQRLKSGGRVPYAVKQRNDVDNLLKPLLDAGTDAGIWEDDGQVFALHNPSKWYAASGEDPGLELTIWEMVAAEQPELFPA